MPYRVAMVSEHASPLSALGGVDRGGQNVYVGSLATHLAALGHEVDIFTRREDARLPHEIELAPRVRVIHVPAGPAEALPKEDLLPHMERFASWMIDRMARERRPYDVVHANFWMSALVAFRIKRALRVPYVVTFHALGRVRRQHQGTDDRFPDDRFDIEDQVVADADRIIAECPQDEADLIALYAAQPAKLAMIPGGFDPREFAPESRQLARLTLGLPLEGRLLLSVGRLVPRKGVDTLIRALAIARREHGVDTRLVVVGGPPTGFDDDPEVCRLREVAAAEGVVGAVDFAGPRGREELRHFYNAADIFISVPAYEPFGMTPLEAMACGRPVIGSDVGGIKFTVKERETGFRVPAGDPVALADRIAYLLKHPAMMKQFGDRGAERATQFFTWARIARAVETVYAEVVGDAGMPAASLADLATVDCRFEGALRTLHESQQSLRAGIVRSADAIAEAMLAGGKLLIAGNGGSAADAQHLAAEFVGRFRHPQRRALPAITLGSELATLSAWSNDVGYDEAMARQVEALGRSGDVLLAISTSGTSRNVIHAAEAARRRGLRIVAMTGRDGGDLGTHADEALVVPSQNTQHIQEVHGVLVHLLAELVEEKVLAREERVAASRERLLLPVLPPAGNGNSHGGSELVSAS